MNDQIIWWILAAVLVAAELMTGTFYLLVYGISAAAAGLAAYFGIGRVSQLLVAAVIGALGTIMLRKWRHADSGSAALQDLDVGQQVKKESWEQGRGKVLYRGAVWDAQAENESVDGSRPLYIRAIRGTVLVVGN
jgi:membrane protein implicated in regulation of membrane protease activity